MKLHNIVFGILELLKCDVKKARSELHSFVSTSIWVLLITHHVVCEQDSDKRCENKTSLAMYRAHRLCGRVLSYTVVRL
jgi:hypothetical protein